MTPIERAETYRLLAAGFRYPDLEDLRATYSAAGVVGGRFAGFGSLSPLVDDDLPGEFNRLFATSVAVSPYETSWLKVDKGTRLGQLAALYDAFGVRPVGKEHELPDHIGIELEFAALLCLKEGLAGTPDEAEVTARGRQIFSEEHLGRWASTFADHLAERTAHPFYAALAVLLHTAIEDDLSTHGWSTSDEAAPQPPTEDAAVVCPMARA